MNENVCKNCNAPLDLSSAKHGVLTCEFCGSSFTLPKTGQSDAVVRLISAGQTALDLCRFDDALAAFSKALELDGTEPEAYWGRALAKLRVQYLKDEVNDRLQPICHDFGERVFSQERDYERALSFSTEYQRAAYTEKAAEIDYIQNEFRRLKESGLDYDCFICVKVTAEDGRPTADSADAAKLYLALKKSGYKPFYSEFEVRDRAGADYEAMILYALRMSESMLIICSDEEYLNTKWVKNEYTRFLSLIADEEKESGSLTIAFRGRPIERLPGRKGKIQGINLSDLDAMDRIRAFIDSHDEEKKRVQRDSVREEEQKKAEEARKREEERQKAEEERKREEEQKKAEEERKREEEQKKAEEERKREEEQKKAEEERKREEEQKKAEEERKREEERQKAEEERKREEEARKLEQAKRSLLQAKESSEFNISGSTLKKYLGKGGAVVVPQGITMIASDAFSGSPVKSVVLPDSVKLICFQAFAGCKSLTDIELNPGLSEIGAMAFAGCDKLSGLKIPESVDTLGEKAFDGCSKLCKKEGGVVYVDNWAVGCNMGTTAPRLRAGTAGIGAFAFYGKQITSVSLPEGLRAIGVSAFKDCRALKNIALPDGLSVISPGTFDGCESLEKIAIPNAVRKIQTSAFSGCNRLKEITWSFSLEEIGNEAFKGCYSLNEIRIPPRVRTIGYNAFADCWAAKSLVFYGKIESIGIGAFHNCSALGKVFIPNSVKSMGIFAFGNDRKNVSILVMVNKKKPLFGVPEGWDKKWAGRGVKVQWVTGNFDYQGKRV